MRHSHPFAAIYPTTTAGPGVQTCYVVVSAAHDHIPGAEAGWWRAVGRHVEARGHMVSEWLTSPEIPDAVRGAMFCRYSHHLTEQSNGRRLTNASERAFFAYLLAEEAEGE